MSTRARNAVLFLALGAALIAAFVLSSRFRDAPASQQDVVDAVPSDAQVLVLAKLSTIRSSPYKSFFAVGAVPSMVPGAETGCGRNLTNRIDTLALWAPAEPGASFGIAAQAPVSVDSVWTCAQSTIAERNGKPSFTDVEGFRIIVDENLGPGSAQIAVRETGLLLLARPTTRSRMMDALAARTPSAANGGDHAKMRKELGQDGDLTVTVIVSKPLRDRFAGWIGEPTPLLDEVDVLGATALLQPETILRATVWCRSEQACTILEKRLNAKRQRVLGSTAMRAIGVAALLENAEISQHGPRLQVNAKARAEQVLGVIERLKGLEEFLEPAPAPAPAVPRGVHSEPDEILRPAASTK